MRGIIGSILSNPKYQRQIFLGLIAALKRPCAWGPKHPAPTVHALYFEPKYDDFRPRAMEMEFVGRIHVGI